MPGTDRPLTETQIIADLRKQLRQQRLGVGGFDPNENPVIIGSGASSGSGTPNNPIVGAYASVTLGLSAQGSGQYSVAIGQAAKALVDHAIAIGSGAQASGALEPVAIGNGATATGNYAVAVGYAASAGMAHGIAVGYQADADDACLAIGWGALANGTNTTMLGAGAVTSGSLDQATGCGYTAAVESDRSTAIGAAAVAGGGVGIAGATALGASAQAQFDHSTAIGADTIVTRNNQVMLGTTVDFIEIAGSGWVLTDTATSTRYLVQITSGALVLNAAP